MIIKQAQIIYSGDVIGVGFRLTTDEIAHNLKLLGWVKNLPNNQVELIVQGEESDIKRLLNQLSQIFRDNIEKSKITWRKPSPELSKFEIKD